MVDHLSTLDEKLAEFRRQWNAKVNAIDLEEIIFQRTVAAMSKKQYDDIPETPDDVVMDEPAQESAPEEATPPLSITAQFDLAVWQKHDIEGKLAAFGGYGIMYIDAPDAFEREPADKEATA